MAVTATNDGATVSFSLCQGGALYRVARWAGLPSTLDGLWWLGIALALLTWIPLAVLSAIGGSQQSPPTVSFLHSAGTHVRFLVAIPLFFFAESLFDRRVPDVLRRLLEVRLLLPEDEPRFRAAIAAAGRARDSWVAEIGLLFLTVALLNSGVRSDLPFEVTTWRTLDGGGATPAGWWYAAVCIPLFQFLLWRWTWRLAIWSQLLWRVARMRLQLIPTHPDRAGGLAVLGVAHVDLSPLAFASSAMLAASYAERIMFAHVPVSAFALSMTAAVLGVTMALIAPLLFFGPKLIDAKQRALLEYGTLAAHYTRAFAAKWLPTDPPPDEPILGTPDIQSLADLGASFDLIRDMSILPIGRAQILFLLGSAAVPFAPLLLLAFPLEEILINSVRSILNL